MIVIKTPLAVLEQLVVEVIETAKVWLWHELNFFRNFCYYFFAKSYKTWQIIS